MATKTDLCGTFGADLLLGGTIAVPRLLLYNYARLNLRSEELILILELMGLHDKKLFPTPAELAKCMGMEPTEVESMLGRLMEAKILSVEKVLDPGTGTLVPAYGLSGLMEKLSELWALDKAKALEQQKKAPKQAVPVTDKLSASTGTIIKAFEKEFGRLLTEIECSNIIEWHEGCKFSAEVILEALKRAVLNQTTNWRYINSILREWDKKNLRTLPDIFADDANFQARQGQVRTGKSRPPAPKKAANDKYKDLYV